MAGAKLRRFAVSWTVIRTFLSGKATSRAAVTLIIVYRLNDRE
jgi:hypothetical protein